MFSERPLQFGGIRLNLFLQSATSKEPKFKTKWAVLETSLKRKREESELKYLRMHQFIECFTSSLAVNIQLISNRDGTQYFKTALFLTDRNLYFS